MTTADLATQQHALYRFYDAGGQLLYVGITVDPGARWKKHGDGKDWWPDVRGVSVEWYGTRAEALAAETRAIQIERPLHNIQRPSLPRRPTSTSPRSTTHQLVWVCDECRLPIADGAGYLHLENRELHDHEQARIEWKAKYPGPFLSGTALFEHPESVKWRTHHTACDPNPDSGAYTIDVNRARTHAKLLDWTAHLMTKGWINGTDWSDLIQRMAAVDA